jgi:hypothetical protein
MADASIESPGLIIREFEFAGDSLFGLKKRRTLFLCNPQDMHKAFTDADLSGNGLKKFF